MNCFRKYFATALISLAALSLFQMHPNVHASGRSSNTSATAGVLLGPLSSPDAVGPNGLDDDFTNLSSIDNTVAAAYMRATVSPAVTIFKNTVENIGPSDDTFLISAPLIPKNFRLAISTDFGDHFIELNSTNSYVPIPVAYRASNTFFIRVEAPAGLRTLTGYDTIIRATSTVDPTVTNETINRLYTGFVRVDAAKRVLDGGQAIDPAQAKPGSELEFIITYTNISTAKGRGSILLTAYNIVISQNGTEAPNDWGVTTEHIVGATDNQGGRIIGDREGSRWLTDIVTSLDAGRSGIFKFKRRIR